MRMKPAEKEDEASFASFVEEIQSHPRNVAAEGNNPAGIKEKNRSLVYLKNELPEMFPPEDVKEEFFREAQERKSHPLESSLGNTGAGTSESPKEVFREEQEPTFMDSFLVELVHTIKNSLASLFHAAVLNWEKGPYADKRSEARGKIREDIKKIDSVLNSLLNFININTPITRSNTLSVILEEVLEANDKQLREKNIRLVKRCEKDLPETYFHAEQVRFVLHSLLQYAIFLTRAHGAVWVLMRSTDRPEGSVSREASRENKGYVEVMIGFNGDRGLGSATEYAKETPQNQRETIDLILTLVREILQRNHGMMVVETSENKPKVLMTARFPVERRKVIYYAPITL